MVGSKAGKDAMPMWGEGLDYLGFGEEMIKSWRLDLPVCLLYFLSTLYNNIVLNKISLERQRPSLQGGGPRCTLLYINITKI